MATSSKKIEHLLKFSEIFKTDENAELADYWEDIKKVGLSVNIDKL